MFGKTGTRRSPAISAPATPAPMSAPLEKYLDGVGAARRLENATEHTYRGFLAQLIGDFASECIAVNRVA